MFSITHAHLPPLILFLILSLHLTCAMSHTLTRLFFFTILVHPLTYSQRIHHITLSCTRPPISISSTITTTTTTTATAIDHFRSTFKKVGAKYLMSYPLLPSSSFYPLSFRISIFFSRCLPRYVYIPRRNRTFFFGLSRSCYYPFHVYIYLLFFLHTYIPSTTLSTHASPTPLQPTSLHCSYFFFHIYNFLHTDSFFQYSSFFLLTCVVSACTLP